jgi:hypothetical protein
MRSIDPRNDHDRDDDDFLLYDDVFMYHDKRMN